MNRFGNDYNPYGRDRDRFETQGAFEERCSRDRIAHDEAALRLRRRREEERESRETDS